MVGTVHGVSSLIWQRWGVSRSLSEARLGLVTTAGLYLRGDRTVCQCRHDLPCLPDRLAAGDLVQSHVSIGFDRTIQRDLNVALLLDRMHELVDQGAIGSLGPDVYAFMGAQRRPYVALEASGADVGGRLRSKVSWRAADRALPSPPESLMVTRINDRPAGRGAG